jgi:hypothetical protein
MHTNENTLEMALVARANLVQGQTRGLEVALNNMIAFSDVGSDANRLLGLRFRVPPWVQMCFL